MEVSSNPDRCIDAYRLFFLLSYKPQPAQPSTSPPGLCLYFRKFPFMSPVAPEAHHLPARIQHCWENARAVCVNPSTKDLWNVHVATSHLTAEIHLLREQLSCSWHVIPVGDSRRQNCDQARVISSTFWALCPLGDLVTLNISTTIKQILKGQWIALASWEHDKEKSAVQTKAYLWK